MCLFTEQNDNEKRHPEIMQAVFRKDLCKPSSTSLIYKQKDINQKKTHKCVKREEEKKKNKAHGPHFIRNTLISSLFHRQLSASV